MKTPSTIQSALLEDLKSDLLAIEAELKALAVSNVSVVHDVMGHTLSSGGKRIRPALVSVAARTVSSTFDSRRAVTLGAVLEMVHMATLIHDDVIDDAETRRGQLTAARAFGNTPAILSGDVLLARAMATLAADGDLNVIRAVSQAVVEMAEGEAREVETRGNFELSIDDHKEILRLKTATLLECCCRLGAMVAGGTNEEIDGLGQFGHHIGIAFQIVDDILDYVGETAATGKPNATDFREGCATLPLILLLPKLNAEELQFASLKFGDAVQEDELRMIVSWMEERGALRESFEAAKEHIRLAKQGVESFAPSRARDSLLAFADFVIDRHH